MISLHKRGIGPFNGFVYDEAGGGCGRWYSGKIICLNMWMFLFISNISNISPSFYHGNKYK